MGRNSQICRRLKNYSSMLMRRIDDYRECRLRTGREKLFGSAAAVAVACCILSKDTGFDGFSR